MFRSLDN